MVYKCKMCGASINYENGVTVCTCEYCGTKQTLPKLDSEKKNAFLERANSYRIINEYDKASAIYEQILLDDNTDAEVFWLNVLCKYGIEYVEEQSTGKRIPTINRVQYNSILKDNDYLKAVELATYDQKELYEKEARYIDNIQSQILEISNREEPFDVFISYKEVDDNGRRTEDSVLAQEIYKQLISEGYKVFYSRITLEDKLGTAYEPYIFAALNSAKVMLAIGTKRDNFESVWVKNEWSRFLSLIKTGHKKILIPCFKDMNPHDLPEEFSYLQAQDLNKIGYMQDLMHGVNKILSANKKNSVLNEIKNITNTNSTSDKKEIIKQLKSLFQVTSKINDIETEMDKLRGKLNSESVIEKLIGPEPDMPYRNFSEISEPDRNDPKYEFKKNNKKSIILLVLIIWLSIALLKSLLKSNVWATVAGIVFIMFPLIPLIKIRNNYSNNEKRYNVDCETYEKYLKKEKEFENEYNEYQQKLEKYKSDREKARIYISEKTNEKLDILNNELNKYRDDIKKFDGIISKDYYKDVGSIISILEKGRADSLKEAINIFEEDEKANALILQQLNQSIKEEEAKRKRGYLQCSHCKRAAGCSKQSENDGNCPIYITKF